VNLTTEDEFALRSFQIKMGAMLMVSVRSASHLIGFDNSFFK
jgi:hypothetical protein